MDHRKGTTIAPLTSCEQHAPQKLHSYPSVGVNNDCRILIPTDIGVTCTPLHIATYPSIQGHTIWAEVRICQTLLYKANSYWAGQLVANILASVISLDL